MSTYTPEEYTVTMTVSDEQYEDMTRNYATSLAKSIKETKYAIAGYFLRQKMGKRLKIDNPYIHGALNAIHEITKTV